MPHRHNHQYSLKIFTKLTLKCKIYTYILNLHPSVADLGTDAVVIGCPRDGARRYGVDHRPPPSPDAIFGSLA
jgi:hypothetical protein